MRASIDALQARLSPCLSKYNLLESRFYQAWSAGSLPTEALQYYAGEYGAFIKLIADGWQGHGDTEIAAEETEHADLWNDFAKSLGTEISEARTPSVQLLVRRARELFSNPSTSMGALYAFEAQQPGTSKSKLEGLQAHYSAVSEGARKYFEIHALDDEEPQILLRRMASLDAVGQERAMRACEEMCELLWNALDGIYEATVATPGCANMQSC